MSQLFDTAMGERRSEVCTREVCEMIVLSETRLRIDTLNEALHRKNSILPSRVCPS